MTAMMIVVIIGKIIGDHDQYRVVIVGNELLQKECVSFRNNNNDGRD
jgi:hypothetical protein